MYYTNRIVIIDKLLNRYYSKRRFIWRYVSPNVYAKWRLGNDYVQSRELKELLQKVLGVWSADDYKLYTSKEDKECIVEYANRTLNHEFNYLGSGWTKLEPLRWNVDFKSGYCWPNGDFYSTYQRVPQNDGTDIKVVWELSRCHHLLWLGQAYMITHDERYAKELVDQILNWIEQNPLMYSINWTCSMDVAFRAINWMYALNMINSSKNLTDEICDKIYLSLYEHGFFIYNNLEKTIPYSGNHYLSDIVGLIYIAAIFPSNVAACRWGKFALREFIREVDVQIGTDGVHYENSTSYHRLVSELFVYTYDVLKKLGKEVPTITSKKINLLADFVDVYTKPNGYSPIFGDNDNGRLLPFLARDYRDHRYLLSIFNNIFGYKYGKSIPNAVEAFFIAKILCLEGQIGESQNIAKRLVVFDQSKIAVYRDETLFLAVTNSEFSLRRKMGDGVLKGTHTHSDLLSFELGIYGADFIVDPGSYVYNANPKLRNYFRSTQKHNTITIDNQTQHENTDKYLFVMKAQTANHQLSGNEGTLISQIVGRYDSLNGYSHERTFVINDNNLDIIDVVVADGSHTISVNFHFAPGVICVSPGNYTLCNNGEIVNASISCCAEYVGNIAPVERVSQISASYGVLQDAQSVLYTTTMENKIRIKTSIQWIK